LTIQARSPKAGRPNLERAGLEEPSLDVQVLADQISAQALFVPMPVFASESVLATFGETEAAKPGSSLRAAVVFRISNALADT
jgi:hypothetical protein